VVLSEERGRVKAKEPGGGRETEKDSVHEINMDRNCCWKLSVILWVCQERQVCVRQAWDLCVCVCVQLSLLFPFS